MKAYSEQIDALTIEISIERGLFERGKRGGQLASGEVVWCLELGVICEIKDFSCKNTKKNF